MARRLFTHQLMKNFLLLILSLPLLVAGCSKSTSAPQSSNSQPTLQANKSAQCDPNYSGCVPVASDVDCAGGGGNGPAYVKGPVTVIGKDIYGLDRDGDGIGCE
jgi:hypothetical protein